LVRTLTRGPVEAANLVVGDTLYGLQDDFSTQEVATITAIDVSVASFRLLKIDGQSLHLPDTSQVLVQNPLGDKRLSTPDGIILNDRVPFYPATDILSGILDTGAYAEGFSQTGDPSTYSYPSKCAYLAGMIDSGATFYAALTQTGFFFSAPSVPLVDTFSTLCSELAGDVTVGSSRSLPRATYSEATRASAMTKAVFDAVEPYLQVWQLSSVDWPLASHTARVIRTDSVASGLCFSLTLGTGGLFLLGNGIAIASE
jgi:hypothetical protein